MRLFVNVINFIGVYIDDEAFKTDIKVYEYMA